jgi:uncharacterized surface protein with fasciclin (FAS1) repeats
MSRKLFATLALAGTFVVGACSDSTTEPAPPAATESIAEIAINAGFTELVGALQYVDTELNAGLVNLFLNGTDQFTVFAPTNAAFQGLYTLLSGVLGTPISQISDLPAPVVLAVLQYHVVAGRQGSSAVVPASGERAVTSLLGETFSVRQNLTIRDGLTGLRSDAAIVSADLDATNGVVHVISQVIVPPSIVAALTN